MTKENLHRLEVIRNALHGYEAPKRAEHTLGVYRECEYLAALFSLDGEDTYALLAAALLHDITKSMDEEMQLALCKEHGVSLPEDVSSVSATLHQYSAAPFALGIFGSETVNGKVQSAVSCHTTGRRGMSLLDKLLFMADFIEFGRKYSSCVEKREYFHSEAEKINKNDRAALQRLLDDTVKSIIGFTVTYLIEKGKKIDAEMISAWNELAAVS